MPDRIMEVQRLADRDALYLTQGGANVSENRLQHLGKNRR